MITPPGVFPHSLARFVSRIQGYAAWAIGLASVFLPADTFSGGALEPLCLDNIEKTEVRSALSGFGLEQTRYVTLNPRLLAQSGSSLHRQKGRFHMNLFTDARCVGVTETTGLTSRGRWRASGRLEDQPGSRFLFVGESDAMAGTVFVPDRGMFQVHYAAPRIHRACELIPPDAGCACLWPSGVSQAAPAANLSAPRSRSIAQQTVEAASSPVTVVDLMVLYTPAAQEASGGERGMNLLIDLAVEEANLCYANSQVQLRLNLVHTGAVPYPESGNLGADLNRLTATNDGFLDDIHSWRDQYAADLVALIVEQESSRLYAGIANQLSRLSPAAASSGFAVIRRVYLTGNYTLAHELGHNFGCDHNRENTIGQTMFTYAYGYRFTVGDLIYRTVMANRPGWQIPHFSNPNVLFLGAATGVPIEQSHAADNASVLNLTAPTVALFREAQARIAFATNQITADPSLGSVLISCLRGGETHSRVAAYYVTRNDSAEAGLDYSGQTNWITFEPGVIEAAVSIPVDPDRSFNEPRTFRVHLIQPEGQCALGYPSVTVVTLQSRGPAAPGALDLSYHTGNGADGRVLAMLARPDGGLLIAGEFLHVQGISRGRIAELTPTGALSSGFDPGRGAKYAICALAAASDRMVYIGGEFNEVNGTNRGHIARLFPTGLLDLSFKPHAQDDFNPDNGLGDSVYALSLQSDGQIVAGGRFTTVNQRPCLHVARFRSNGSHDSTFAMDNGPDAPVYALAIQPDGKILLGGDFTTLKNHPCPGLARLTPGGDLDPSFNPPLGLQGQVRALALQADGRVLAAGRFLLTSGLAWTNLARFNPDGSPDLSFGNSTGPNDTVHCLAIQSDGRIILGGAFTDLGGTPRNRVGRLNSDGSLDGRFNAGSGPNDAVYAVALQPDGNIGIGGCFTAVDDQPRYGFARLIGEPARIPPPLGLQIHGFSADGLCLIGVTNVSGYACLIETSDDLRLWVPVVTNPPTGLEFMYLDPHAFQRAQRFYRAQNIVTPP
ncbi:MAG TPA: M12 family metallo-peptidase [Candidatus Paceibacterota bacterium]|nr:M12 family metallo-peptidase [Candidatus Paceibacterota bacterium]